MQRMRAPAIAIAALAAGVLVALGFSRLSFEVEVLKMLPPDLTQVRGLSAMLEHFGFPDEVILTLVAENRERAEELADSLAQELRQHPLLVKRVVTRPPWEAAPDELAEVIAFAALNQPPAAFEQLSARLDAPGSRTAAVAAFEEVAGSPDIGRALIRSYDPFQIAPESLEQAAAPVAAKSEFVSADGTFRAVYVQLTDPGATYRDTIRAIRELRGVVSEWAVGQSLDVEPGMTGEPVFVAEISSSMERDMKLSGVVTLSLVALVFWLVHRRFRPLLLLLAVLAGSMVIALGMAGLVLGSLTVISVGFAAILIGLSVDYGLIVHQQACLVGRPVGAIRRAAAPSILWAAATTSAAFLSLNFGSFPALAQLGTLVAIGAIASAALMLGPFASLIAGPRSLANERTGPIGIDGATIIRRLAWPVCGLLVLAAAGLIKSGFPSLETGTGALHPEDSIAFRTMEAVNKNLLDSEDNISVLITAETETEMRHRIEMAAAWLGEFAAAGRSNGHALPAGMFPDASAQRANLMAAVRLAARGRALEQELIDAGFTAESAVLTHGVLDCWAHWAEENHVPVSPGGDATTWMLRRMISEQPSGMALLGVVFPAAGISPSERDLFFDSPGGGIFGVQWERLGVDLAGQARGDAMRLAIIFGSVLLALLGLAYRNPVEPVLTLLLLLASLLALSGTMAWFGMRWNFFNLAALLLVVGAGVDFSLHMMFALRRHGGDIGAALARVGNPITLCALTTIIGFGSLGLAANIGLASLGKICALGILFNYLLAVFVLPPVWRRLRPA